MVCKESVTLTPQKLNHAQQDAQKREEALVEGDLLDSDWQERLQREDLPDQWGQKPATSGQEFAPIPAGAIQRENLTEEPESTLEERPADADLYFESADEQLNVPDDGITEFGEVAPVNPQ